MRPVWTVWREFEKKKEGEWDLCQNHQWLSFKWEPDAAQLEHKAPVPNPVLFLWKLIVLATVKGGRDVCLL